MARRMALSERMRQLSQRYQQSIDAARPSGLPEISRSQVETIVDALSDVGGPKVVAVVGSAGSGKSTVISQVLRELETRNIVVGPFG